MGAAVRRVMNPELRDSPAVDFFKKYNNEAEKADRVLKSGIGICSIIQMKSSTPKMAEKIGGVLDSARTIVSISRTPGLVVKLFTGSVFTHYVEEPAGQEVTNEGTVVNKVNIVEKRRDWLDIAIDLFLLVARILNPVSWLHRMGIVDLGKHFSRIGNTIGCAFTAVTTLCFVQTVRDLIDGIEESLDMARLKKKIADCFSGLIDMLSIPFDCGMAFSSSPEVALASACMGIASGAVWLGKEMLMDS